MLKHLLVATALVLPLAPALAQEGAPASAPMPAAPAELAQSDGGAPQDPGVDTLAERIGETVYSPTGEPLGELTGVVVDGGSSPRAVISHGGVMGIGSREVSVAPVELSVQPGGEGGEPRLVLGMAKDELEALPEYDPKQAEVAASLPQPSSGGTAAVDPAPPAGDETAGLGTEAEQAVAEALARVEQAWTQVEGATADGWHSAQENFRQAVTDLERTWDEVTAEEQQAQQPQQPAQ